MPDRVTLDVIDRPGPGLRRSLRHLRRLRASSPSGPLRAVLALGTAKFASRPVPGPTPRRIAVLAAWEDDDRVDERWSVTIGDLATGAREHWHVEAEVVRARFSQPWKGWMPVDDGARPLEPSEPALVLISGDLRARYLPAFLGDGARAVAHAFAHPGFLAGLAINSSLLNTTSCSCWRTYAEARAYAFKPGGHVDAVRRDRARGHHKTDYFLRLRPLRERGTLAAATPFGGVLA